MDNIPDRPAPLEAVVLSWVWLAWLVVIACAVGPVWSALALALSAACFALYVTWFDKRSTRKKKLTRSRAILRKAADGILAAVSTMIVILVYAVALLGPSVLVGGVLWVWIGVWALPVALAVVPLGRKVMQRLPARDALREAVLFGAVWVSPLG